jgi:hypothetical protein
MQKILANHLGLPHKLTHRHALRLQRVKGEAHIGILVVDEGAEDAGRQVAGFIPELLTGLVELILNCRGRRAVFQRDREKGVARPGYGLDTVVPGQFLDALLERLSDKILHLARCCAWPRSRDRQGLDGEGGVLSAPELDEGIDACGSQQNDEEQGDGSLANRERGKIEAHQFAASA